jgi:hypothetical protein
VSYPANLANTIAVGASTDFDYRSAYSQYGATLDFVAPSSGGYQRIVTTDRTGVDGYNSGSDYTTTGSDGFGGTSSAAPLAAGVAALLLSADADLTAADVRTIMRETADKIGGDNGNTAYDGGGFNQYYGYGRIDAGAALGAIVSAVTGRHLFYDNSTYDGDTAGINSGDPAAIAADKTAYLPGDGIITPASMSSYSRGLNGIFVDMTGPHGALSLSDFEFRISSQGSGASNNPSTWSTAPAPTSFTVLSDNPAAGTDRVEFIWDDNDIENRYLEVRVLGNDTAGSNNTNTGLAETDVFYFGNIIGDTFVNTGSTVFLTSAADETGIQGSPIVSAASITSVFDMDRNGAHTAGDRLVTRGNTITALNRIDITSPPPAPAEATVEEPTADGFQGMSAASQAATRGREFEPGFAWALATEHWRRQLLASASPSDWLDGVDEPLLDLLGRHRFARRQ